MKIQSTFNTKNISGTYNTPRRHDSRHTNNSNNVNDVTDATDTIGTRGTPATSTELAVSATQNANIASIVSPAPANSATPAKSAKSAKSANSAKSAKSTALSTPTASNPSPAFTAKTLDTPVTPASDSYATSETKAETKEILYIDPETVMPNRAQPRTTFEQESLEKLAESIRKYGVIQPLTVRKLASNRFSTFKYELIAGERRLRASKLAGLDKVPCVIMETDEKTSAALAIIENLHRDDLNIFEEASAIASLIEIHKLTQEKIASELSLTQSAIANKLRILKLTTEERQLILSAGLTERHARAFLRLKDPIERFEVAKRVAAKCMNVKQTEEYIDSLLSEKESSAVKSFDYKTFLHSLTRSVETVRRAGGAIKTSQSESETDIIYVITIPKVSTESQTEVNVSH